MKTLEKFKKFELSSAQCGAIKGGVDYYWCTNGFNEACYSTLEAAYAACYPDLSCTEIRELEVE